MGCFGNITGAVTLFLSVAVAISILLIALVTWIIRKIIARLRHKSTKIYRIYWMALFSAEVGLLVGYLISTFFTEVGCCACDELDIVLPLAGLVMIVGTTYALYRSYFVVRHQ